MSTEVKKKSIDYRFKILYAVAMIVTVGAHCEDGSLNLFFDWMPYGGIILSILMFSSGYFYKKESEDHPLLFIKKKAKQLLIPLYLWNVFYGLLTWFLHQMGFTIGEGLTLHNLLLAPFYNGHQFMFNLATWYVGPLFTAELLYMLLRKGLSYIKKDFPETPVMLFCLGLGILACEISILGYHDGWILYLEHSLSFLTYYAAGVYYRRVLERFDRLPNIPYFLIIMGIQMVMFFIFHRLPFYIPSKFDSFPEGPVIPYIVGFLGIAFWLRIARILEPGLGKDPWINTIADESYAIMLHQFLGFMGVKTVYALIAKFTSHFADFDFALYKSDIWYYYTPPRLPYYSMIFYLIAGLALPIAISKVMKRLRALIFRKKN
ncbi:MAG: acyltransferase [Lachnospiraceae bacterium]|nr:acyltransferase [Lachnospiraceae bacterium]